MERLSIFSMICLLSLSCAAQTSWPIKQFHQIENQDQIAPKQLTPEERASIVKPLCRIAAIEHCTDDALSGSFRFTRVSLTGTAKDSVLVQGLGSDLCGATGNCTFVVFDGDGRIVLNTYGVQRFLIARDLSNGRFDIVTSQHDSANESILRRFRFDGHKYRSFRCADLIYGDLNHPDGPPHIKSMSCANGPEER